MITYNDKNILKSFIGNKRLIKKYLNNKIVYGTPDFAQYYNIQGYDNYKVVGSPTITDGVASGFSRNNYLTAPINPQNVFAYEEVIRVKIPSTFTQRNYITGYAVDKYGWALSIPFGTKTYAIALAKSTSDTSAWRFDITTNVSPIYDQFYYIRFTWNGNTFLWEHSTNKENWSTIYSYNSSDFFYSSGNKLYGRGATNQSWYNDKFLEGEIDLNNTYIKVNGKYWFNGNPNYKELFDCNPNVYLQSTGTQYIDTEILPNSNLEFDVKFLTSNTIGSSGYGCIFGGRYNSGNNDLQVTTFRNNQANTSGTFRFGLNTTDASQSAGITLNVAIEAHFHNLTYSTNTTNYTVPTYNFTNPRKIFLFGLNGNGTMMQSGKGCKIYYAKFNKSTQRSYFVPVPEGLQIGSYKVPSNGMFDIVTQTFFENKGSGEFIWGVDL